MKKVFVLAGITAVTGLIVSMAAAGCSSSTTEVVETDAADAAHDSSPKDVFVPDDDASDASGTCPTTDPVAASDIETADGVWQSPPIPPLTVCTQANLDALKSAFANAPATGLAFTDIMTALGTSCSTCAFSAASTTPPWGIFVGDSTAGYLDNRYGSCLAQYTTPACGKAAFELDACFDAVCPTDTCTNQDACATAAAKGACSTIVTTFQSACAADTSDIDTNCENIIFSIEASCGGGPDAGLDAASP